MTTYWLNLHAAYRCRDSGACCSAGWPIPVEAVRRAAIDGAVAAGRLAPAHWLEPHAAAPAGVAGTFRRTPEGACVFHRGGAAGCAVHATLGHPALPAACQHFPRLCVIDRRGVHVTLSHYCPTAVDLLFTHRGPVRIVEGPPAVPGLDVPEGLDVRDALPPLLTPRVLMDLDGYAAWERHAVEALAGDAGCDRSAEGAVARLLADAEDLAAWTPASGRTLAAAVEGLGASRRPPAVPPAPGLAGPDAWSGALGRWQRVVAACPPEWPWPAATPALAAVDAGLVAPSWEGWAVVVRRYLAAVAYASWAPWQGRGPRATAGLVACALAVLRVETARVTAAADRPLDEGLLRAAVRQADLLLRHHADRQALADLATPGFARTSPRD